MFKPLNRQFDVQKIVHNYKNYQIAGKYYRNDCINKVEVRSLSDQYYVSAEVEVASGLYECSFKFDDFGNVYSFDCECPFCESKSPCAHIGAVLYKMNTFEIDELPFYYEKEIEVLDWFARFKKEQEERKRRWEQEQAERQRRWEEEQQRIRQREMLLRNQLFIDGNKEFYQNQLLGSIGVDEYQIVPEVTKEGEDFNLSYRIGTSQKRYVVKSIDALIDKFNSRESVTYGKNMTILHDESYFDDFSKQQIEFLHRIVLENSSQNNYYRNYDKIGRSIEINANIKSFIPLFCALYKDKKYPTFYIEECMEKIPLTLTEEEKWYKLQLEYNRAGYLANHLLLFLPQEMNPPFMFRYMSLEKQPMAMRLLKELIKDEKKELLVFKEQWDEFYKYCLFPCMKIFDIQGTIAHHKDEVNYEKIELYGDILDSGDIIAKLQFIDKHGQIIPAFQENMLLDYNQDLCEAMIRKYARTIENHIAYFDPDSDNSILFFSDGIEKLKEYCDIYVTDALRSLKAKVKYSLSVGVRIENDLLAIDVDSMSIPKEELSSVLSSYRKRKRFYKLRNGQIINLNSSTIEELDDMLEQFHLQPKDLKEDTIYLDKNRMFAMEENSHVFESLDIIKEKSFEDALSNFKQIQQKDIQIPNAYSNILRDYQKDGYRWMYTLKQYQFHGILADDMGLGKTLQVIALLEETAIHKRNIVICPSSLIYNWEDEVHKFSKQLKVLPIVGTKEKRRELIKMSNQYDILVTSYDYMRRDFEDYENIQFEYVILDEAQNIKNQKTKNAVSVKSLQAKHRLALTGTPIENTLAELWSIFDFLMPNYLYNYHYFKQHFENEIVKNNNEEMTKKLQKMVSPFILRRIKKEVLTELPDKIESVQYVPFDEEENKLYLAFLSQANTQLQKMLNVDHMDKLAILALLTRLRQLCIEPRMVYENIEKSSSKIQALLERIMEFKASGQNVLVFSAFPSVFSYIEEELNKENIRYLTLTGETTKEERKEMVTEFQNGEVDVFLISLKAGGTGLNLTAASAVIHIDPWWNLSAQNQATDRAYRFGQDKNVQVIKLVMKNSIEERIVKLQEMKKELSDLFVENNEGSIARMSKEDILDLFKL